MLNIHYDLDKADGTFLSAEFPLVFGQLLMINLKGIDRAQGPEKLSKEDLKVTVEKELESLAAYAKTEFQCVRVKVPQEKNTE